MNAPPVVPGDVLARKYRVERVLGAGNMGVVVAARHVELGQLVALKHLLTGQAISVEQRERFLREARAAVLLKSHHVAKVIDVGTDDNNAPYIVMELLEGQDLAAILRARGQLSLPEAVDYVLQASEAIGEAHAAGIVHRDLKPANMFLTEDVSGAPIVKVLDFGISKLTNADVALTQETQWLGTPLYMSPEQMAEPKTVDSRSDIWALGVILYQLVAGKPPFYAETIQGVCGLVMAGQPTPLSTYRPDLPSAFEAVILRCLSRDRNARFQNVAELGQALLPFAPAHARVYVDRIARVVGAGGAGRGRGGSSADLSVAMPPAAAVATQPLPAMMGGVGGSPSLSTISHAAMSPSPSVPDGVLATPTSRPKPWLLVGVGLVSAMVALGITISLLMVSAPRATEAVSSGPVAVAPPVLSAAEVPAVLPAEPVPTPALSASSSPMPAASASASPSSSTKAAPTVTAAPTNKARRKDPSLYEP